MEKREGEGGTVMKLYCRFMGHKWSSWREVEHHLESKCMRKGCGTKRAKYPPPSIIFAKFLTGCAEAFLKHKLDKERTRFGLTPSPRIQPSPFLGLHITYKKTDLTKEFL